MFIFFLVIPQSCKYKGQKFECGLSISCVLSGGRPVDLCSGGMIWSCCVDDDDIPDKIPPQQQQTTNKPPVGMGLIQNASKSEFSLQKFVKTSFFFIIYTRLLKSKYCIIHA